MITTKSVTKNVTTYKAIPVEDKKKIIEYTCSDGKKFTNERDQDKGYKTGLQLAEEHETYLDKIIKAKEELNFVSINDNKSEGYEREFCFYYKSDLSESTKLGLIRLVYEIGNLADLKDGWYYVNQYVYEIDSCSRNCQYSSDSEFEYLDDKIKELQYKLNNFMVIQNKIIK